MHLVDLLEAAGGEGSEDAGQPGGETGADDDGEVALPGVGVEGEQAGDVVDRIGRGHHERPGGEGDTGQVGMVARRGGEDHRGPGRPVVGGLEGGGEVGSGRRDRSERLGDRLAAARVGLDHDEPVEVAQGDELTGRPGADGAGTDEDRVHEWKSCPVSSRQPPRSGAGALPPRSRIAAAAAPARNIANSARLFTVGLAGIEPATSPLSGVRSNRLSYSPAKALVRRSLGGENRSAQRLVQHTP